MITSPIESVVFVAATPWDNFLSLGSSRGNSLISSFFVFFHWKWTVAQYGEREKLQDSEKNRRLGYICGGSSPTDSIFRPFSNDMAIIARFIQRRSPSRGTPCN
mmetsp:Transcript_30123/g.45930  ORF Transcript_30123/g.45930 Transcript_30123/m.45930 type:complete len:104 (+) Transcript_30123:982-1293(+)